MFIISVDSAERLSSFEIESAAQVQILDGAFTFPFTVMHISKHECIYIQIIKHIGSFCLGKANNIGENKF